MRKGQSRCHIVGKQNNEKVLLIHGMGFYWKNCFKDIVHELSDRYCVIMPELEGHNLACKGNFSSVYSSAENIIGALYNQGYKNLHGIYGISLGASIALEIALRNQIQTEKLILDGGQFESMGMMKRIYAFIMAKELKKIMNGKHMTSYVQKQMGYLQNNDIDVLQPLTCRNISFRCLYRTALAAYSYDISDRNEKLAMDVIIMYGENEVYAKRSIPIVEKKCQRSLNVFECKGMGHAETLSTKSSDICAFIQK